MKMDFVCVDFDSTLFDFKGGFLKFLETKGYMFNPNEIKDYWFRDTGLEDEVIRGFMKDVTMWREFQKFYPNAEESLGILRNHINILAYTGCPDSDEVLKHKQEIIEQYGFLKDSTPYKGWLKKPVILEAKALFDDNLGVHRDWISAGYKGKLYLIKQTYNEDLTDEERKRITVCNSFSEAVNLFLGI